MIARGVVVSKLANKQACNATKTFEKSHLTYYVIFFLLWQNLKWQKISISNLENLKNALANQRKFKWQKFSCIRWQKNIKFKKVYFTISIFAIIEEIDCDFINVLGPIAL